jgi:hypothetical protein
MSVVAYCPYLAAQSFARKMLYDNKPAVDIAIGLLLWVLILVNVGSCVWAAQVSDIKRAVAAAEEEAEAEREARVVAEEEAEEAREATKVAEAEAEEAREDVKESDSCIHELEGVVQGLREKNLALNAEVESLRKQKMNRKVIGMKIVVGHPRDYGGNTGSKSLEELVVQCVKDGWEISGAPMRPGDSGTWFQNMLRYEVEAVAAREPAAPEPVSGCYMLNAEQVAEKIRALPKGVWQTSYDIQKALAPAPPHKTPFAAVKTINSALYAMLGKGEVEKGKHEDFVRPIWKML